MDPIDRLRHLDGKNLSVRVDSDVEVSFLNEDYEVIAVVLRGRSAKHGGVGPAIG